MFAPSPPDIHPVFRPYMTFWSDWLEQANESTRRFVEGAQTSADPKDWQRRWLETVSQSIDAYLRSPLFLNAMKKFMDAVIKAKMNTDGLQKEFARNANIPTASDLSGLFERLRGLEELILSSLGETNERLKTIEERAKS